MEFLKKTQLEKNLKTPYQWCIEDKINLIDINEWGCEWYGSKEKHFFEFPVFGRDEFDQHIKKCKIEENTLQHKTELYLEYRMYGLVPYNLSPIQQGIQFGHAVVEYGQNVKGMGKMEDIYNKWANEDKTFIILNGGTTNINPDKLGSLNKHVDTLMENGVAVATFYEPDLGDQLTAIVFLVDERVFNRDLYPDYVEPLLPLGVNKYEDWVKTIGNAKNFFLREFLSPKNFRLA